MSGSTKRTVIFSLLFMLAASLGFFFMLSQTSQEADVLEEQIDTLRTERLQEVSFIRMQRIADETVDERAALGSVFLERESESIDFLNLVEGMAPQAGVTLRTSELETVVDGSDGSEWIEVTFEFAGAREQVENFFDVLENLPYITRVMGIEMEVRSSTLWEASVQMRVRIYEYGQ